MTGVTSADDTVLNRGRCHNTLGSLHDVSLPDCHVLTVRLHVWHEFEPRVLLLFLVEEGGRITWLTIESDEVTDFGALGRL